ncbi:MAG: hypothetical protein GY820_10420 [Gammaproteobacteria bacterium]|nr:hypothetical protein [Gammaproteobacteria bacterium]
MTQKTVEYKDDWRLYNVKTGEIVEDIDIFEDMNPNLRWDKIYAKEFADMLDLSGESRTAILAYLLRNKDHRNLIIATQGMIAKETGTSIKTVNRTVKQMIQAGYLTRPQNGVLLLSPYVIRPGAMKSGMAVVRRWSDSQEQDYEES